MFWFIIIFSLIGMACSVRINWALVTWLIQWLITFGLWWKSPYMIKHCYLKVCYHFNKLLGHAREHHYVSSTLSITYMSWLTYSFLQSYKHPLGFQQSHFIIHFRFIFVQFIISRCSNSRGNFKCRWNYNLSSPLVIMKV